MKRPKTARRALGALAALPLLAGAAAAQMDLKIMAPAGPGGGWDQTARAMQSAMTASGAAKSVQVINVPGAGGTIGLAQLVTSAKGDGHQLMVNGLVMVGAIITNKSAMTLDRATPIARLTAEYLAFVVPANSPIKDAAGLAAALKADPGKVTWAGGSAGGVDHIAAALFAKAVGADATKINYIAYSGGGEALAALLGGKVTAGVSGYGEFEGQIKAKRLRVVAVTSPARLAGVDAPTFKEQNVDLVIANWRSVMAPPGLSDEQLKALAAAVEKMAKSPAWAEVLKQKGWDDAYLGGRVFADFLKAEQSRVAEILKAAAIVK